MTVLPQPHLTCGGSGHAGVGCGPTELIALDFPARAVGDGQNLSVYNREGPVAAPIMPGKYTLHQVFSITASQDASPGLSKGASAEFAPDPALDASWLGQFEPFHGAAKKDFGFQITLKVVAE